MVEYECQEGYTLVGEARISCTFINWSPLAPQCKGNLGSLIALRDRATVE